MVLRPVVLLSVAAASLCAQSLPGLSSTPKNLDFSEGKVGAAPPGWVLGPENQHPQIAPVYKAEIAAGAVCDGSPRCVVVSSLRDGTTATGARLFQLLDATPYRGQVVTLRAALRAEVAAGNSARLMVRIHDDRGGVSDYGGWPQETITSARWSFYQVDVPVQRRAVYLEIGVQMNHVGRVWLDCVSLVSEPRAPRTVTSASDEAAISAMMTRFATSRNAGDGRVTAENYSEDGEYLAIDGGRVRGREALARMWTAGPYGGGPAARTVEKIDFVSANIALVRGKAEFETGPARNETFVVVRDSGGGWKIQLHEPAIAK